MSPVQRIDPQGRHGEAIAASRERYAQLRRAHANIANEIAKHSEEGRALLIRAKRNVDRWESERLCSSHYVRVWRRILEHPERMQTMVVREGDLVDALMQNSPFGSAIKNAMRH